MRPYDICVYVFYKKHTWHVHCKFIKFMKYSDQMKANDTIWKCRFIVILLFYRFRKCFRNHLTSNYEGRYHLELYKYIFCKLYLPLTELESLKYYTNYRNIKHIEMSWIFCILRFAFNRSSKIYIFRKYVFFKNWKNTFPHVGMHCKWINTLNFITLSSSVKA